MIGALLGDIIKGPLKGLHPQRWEQGIQLHRMIDGYTDKHPIIKNCSALFPRRYRRYSGIMLDVVFDHFLIKHWQQHHSQSLSAFTQETYQLLTNTDWPDSAKTKAARIVQYDLLNNYQDWPFIMDVLTNIGKRLRHNNPLSEAEPILTQLSPNIEQAFIDFYPQLENFAQQTRQQMNK